MNAEIDTARDDLAYMRALVSGGGGRAQATAGEIFLWAGLLYGLQCIGHWLDVAGGIDLPPVGMLALSFGPTAVFLVVIGAVIWRERRTPRDHGAASRALGAVFQGAGLANLVLAFVFAYGSYKAQSITIWLYHPTVVCMFQGVAWFVAWTILRHTWLGLVSIGWFAATIACGVFIDNPAAFLLTIGFALILLMALPGYVMMRAAKHLA
jgi:hypothetical protein